MDVVTREEVDRSSAERSVRRVLEANRAHRNISGKGGAPNQLLSTLRPLFSTAPPPGNLKCRKAGLRVGLPVIQALGWTALSPPGPALPDPVFFLPAAGDPLYDP